MSVVTPADDNAPNMSIYLKVYSIVQDRSDESTHIHSFRMHVAIVHCDLLLNIVGGGTDGLV